MSEAKQKQADDFRASFKEMYERTAAEVLNLPRSDIRVDVDVHDGDESKDAYRVIASVFVRGEPICSDSDDNLRITKAVERVLNNAPAN